MKTIKTCCIRTILPALTVLFLCTACTGIDEKQVALDPVISTTDNMRQFVTQQRREFFQLKDAYLKSKQPVHLSRMSEIMELVRDELERAEYFQKNTRYYRSGLDHGRWRNAGRTYEFCRKTLCEMMIASGELHMQSGDTQYAAALFRAVVEGFEPGEDIAVYVEQANLFVQQLEKSDLYAKSTRTNNRHSDN